MIPEHAASVWLSGDHLRLHFPGFCGNQGHTVRYPVDMSALRALSIDHKELRGLTLMLDTLQYRHAGSEVGTKGSPVADDIRKAVSSKDRYKAWLARRELTAAETAQGDLELKELGL
jgi:hypothetical protein